MVNLTIAIPTYNRKTKLERLLNILSEQISTIEDPTKITILVSNNNSTDGTDLFLNNYKHGTFAFKFFNQSSNLGFDGNIKFLYEQASSDYIWFHSDDDIPLSGSLAQILEVINTEKPNLLLFSFQQPLGSSLRQFNYQTPIYKTNNHLEIIENIWTAQKISTWVIKKVEFDAFHTNLLHINFWESGFFFMSIAFTTYRFTIGSMCIISRQLITCDEEYTSFFFDPIIFLTAPNVLKHPYVQENHPMFSEEQKRKMKACYILFLWQILIRKNYQSKEGSTKSYKLGVRKINSIKLLMAGNLKVFIMCLIIKTHLKFQQ